MNPLSSAKWITDNTDCASPILERNFSLETLPEKAVLFITGLGYFEARVNGRPVTDARFIPVISDYHARDVASFYYPIRDTFTHRVYYYEFDISPLLKKGENTLSIQLGGGWYRQYERTAEGPTYFGDTLKAIYTIDLGDRKLVSDGTETWRESCIRYSSLFIGEIHDGSFSDRCPKPVSVTEFPETTLSPAIGTPDREIRVIEPKHLGWKDGKNVYDCGENISGHVRITTKGPKGYPVTVRFAEELTADGELDFSSTGYEYIGISGQRQIMSDTFLCPGGE